MPADMSKEEEQQYLAEMRVNQLLIASLTIVGNAENILAGRKELMEFVATLSPAEVIRLFCAAVETVAMKIAMDTASPDEFNEVLQHVGAIMAHLIENPAE